MSKEKYMVEFEKGMVQKLYSDIGKEVVEGVTIEEAPIDHEDKRIMKEAEWQERKWQLQGLFLLLSKVIFFVEYLIFPEFYY